MKDSEVKREVLIKEKRFVKGNLCVNEEDKNQQWKM